MASRNRGKTKPTIRSLSREHPTTEEAVALSNLLNPNGPDIVIAIVGQSIIEIQLEQMLRKKIPRKDEDTWVKLTDIGGSLDTFYSKIVMGYAFKLYDSTLENNLNIVRNIRNAFAHAKRPLTFEHELIRKELSKIQAEPKSRSPYQRSLREAKSSRTSPKLAYSVLCLSTSSQLIKFNIRTIKSQTRRIIRQRKKRERDILANALLGSDGGQKNFLLGLIRDQKL